MEKYFTENQDQFIEEMIEILEEKEQSRVFTLRVLDQTEDGLEILVVLRNKKILRGLISVDFFKDFAGVRVQASYI